MMIGGHLCRMDCFGSTTHATMRRYIHRWRKTSFRRQGSQSKDGSTHPHNSTSSKMKPILFFALLNFGLTLAVFLMQHRTDDETKIMIHSGIGEFSRATNPYRELQNDPNHTSKHPIIIVYDDNATYHNDHVVNDIAQEIKKHQVLMAKGDGASFIRRLNSHIKFGTETVEEVYPKTDIKVLNWALDATKDDSNILKMDFGLCPTLPRNKTCTLVTDRNLYNQSDLVIFNVFSYGMKSPPWPLYKPKNQMWLFYGHEPQAKTTKATNIMPYANMFDITASFKEGSDIFLPFGDCKKKFALHSKTDIGPKSGLAVWFVSKCSTDSARENYVNELKKYIDIDIFGACGLSKCELKDYRCLKDTIKDYKFYLAFENSFCDGYITEKAYRALELGTVPIMLGTADYKTLLPPNSFIDVRNFTHPRDLGRYINMLNKNDSLYKQYLQWHDDYECESKKGVLWKSACELCDTAHKYRALEHKPSMNIMDFWNKEKDCMSSSQFYEELF